MQLVHKIHHLRFREIGDFMSSQYGVKKVVAENDLILLIVTAHFLATEFCYSTELSQLLEANNLRNVQLIPLVFTSCHIEGSILHKLERLPSNTEPLINPHTYRLEQPLFVVSGELESKIERIRFFKGKVENAWQNAQVVNEYNSYRAFIDQFPFSLFRPEAERRANEMLEAKLWKEAKAFDNITHLLHYLKDAPDTPAKFRHKQEALDRIAAIEGAEATVGNDAIDSRNLPLLLDYLRRYPRGSQAPQAHSQFSDLMDDLFSGREQVAELEAFLVPKKGSQPTLKTESQRLRYLALQLLKPDEIMALDSYCQFGQELYRKAKGLSDRLKGNASFFQMSMPTFVVVSYMAYLMLGDRLAGQDWAIYLFVMLGIGLLYGLFVGNRYMTADAQICSDMAEDLRRKLTELRVAFLFHDRITINRLLFEMVNAQSRLQRLSSLGMGDYMGLRVGQGE